MPRILSFIALLFVADLHAADAFEQQRRLGRCVNLGNALEAPSEGEWGWKIADEDLSRIKQAGFDSVRIPIRWSAHANPSPPYQIDPVFAERVNHVVRTALAKGLAVVMNVHHYDELDANPGAHRERLAGIWRQIAEKYQAYPDALHFEIYNEPHGKLNASEWNSTWVLALAEIRKTNPQRAVHIGGVQWNQSSTLKDLQLPEADRHIIGHFHCYAPFQFTHQGAEWVGGSSPWVGTKWVATPAEQAEILKVFSLATEWSKQTQRPVFLGEYGSYGKYADAESRVRWTAFMATTARKNGIPAAYWEYCAGFGLWNPLEKQWREPLLGAVLSR